MRTARSTAVVTKRELVTIVRRLGFVAAKMHESLMNNLCEAEAPWAEDFNDAFKPVVDWLLKFDIPDFVSDQLREEDEDGKEV